MAKMAASMDYKSVRGADYTELDDYYDQFDTCDLVVSYTK
jgi:hypothetical protein